VRNGYYVPSKKSAFVTVAYLVGVKSKEWHVPLYKDVRLRPCPQPPKKALLVDTIIAIGNQRGVDFGLRAGGPMPNTQWLLAVISTYKPDHAYFGKGYRPQRAKEDRVLDNDDGFYDNLPQALYQNKKVKRSTVLKRLLKPLPPALVVVNHRGRQHPPPVPAPVPAPVLAPVPRRAPDPPQEEHKQEDAGAARSAELSPLRGDADMQSPARDLQRGRPWEGNSGLTPAMKEMVMSSPGSKRGYDEFQGGGMGRGTYESAAGLKRQRTGSDDSGRVGGHGSKVIGSFTPFPDMHGNPAPGRF
jgi:hypothetical protein